MPTYVVTSHTAMILLAILAVFFSSITDTASRNATGTASLTTMVRRSGPVTDLSVPLVALDPNSQYSLLYSLTSATLAHGGGIRFTKDSPEYTTILEWIKGAKE